MLVGDGMADFPVEELGGKTVLEYAYTPNMDRVVSQGRIGLVSTVPDGFLPGSDVANMSLMGYDPAKYYSGRAPVEAASMGIKLSAEDIAFRCNFVTIENGIMRDYSAGHIETSEAAKLIATLQDALGSDTVRFYPGVSYRHLLVVRGVGGALKCVPPHDITGREVSGYLPSGKDSEYILSIMNNAREVLTKACGYHNRMREIGSCAATDIWLWGQGPAVSLPSLKEKFGISGSVISAVDLIRGLGKLAGLNVRIVEGATGYLGTNYAGKVAAAVSAFENGEDFVYLHVEAPDETSHEGSLEKKILAIEEFDKYVVGEMLDYQEKRGDLRIIVLPDHATPVSLRTHDAMAVPFGMCGPGVEADSAAVYCEKAARGSVSLSGPSLFEVFIS